MLRNVFSAVSLNKNILMLVSVGIYILALFGVLSGQSLLIGTILTLFLIFGIIKDYFPIKTVILWVLIFYVGIINTTIRLNNTDSLVNLTPINSTVQGKIVSVPQTKNNKTQFFFDINKIEYDGIVKDVNKEKVLVSLNTDEKFQIYDSYKIRGRLSVPFKAGNPSQFDYGNYLKNYNTYMVFYGRNPYSMKDLDIPCYEKEPVNLSFLEKTVQKINLHREKILKTHSSYLQSPNLEILGGIVFGDDAVAPPENIKKSFVNSGLLHILAASGMNVAFIYSFFFLILKFFKVPFKPNIIFCIFMVLIYVLMTGLGASVVRAALMLIFVLIGKLIDRDAHSIALLSFVALLMLLYNPMYINDVGFQLSFIVTFGLLLMTPILITSKNKIIDWLIGTVSIPIIAQLWVIPIQIFYFNNISIYSVFANIMSVPILFVISFGGFISSLLSLITPISHIICRIFDFILNPLITVLVNISDFWGNLPNSTHQTTHPEPYQIILYYMILLIGTSWFIKEFREKWSKYIKISLPAILGVLLISTIPLPNHNLEITAFDVGNADSFMIKTPKNEYIMVDTGKGGYNGGKSQAEIIMLKYFIDRGIKDLNSIIVTHFDNDHCGGTVDLIKKLNVERIYVNSLNHDSRQAQEIYKTAKENNTEVLEAENNQTVYDKFGLKIKNYIIKDIKGIGDNESSIITLLTYKDFSMLFTGDAGIETLNKLKSDIPQNLTVLKVGHHGASGVINRELVKYLNPQYSVVSTGENKFGHPSIYTIDTLKDTRILRTDTNNSIKFIVNSSGFKVQNYDSVSKKYKDLF